MACDSIVIELSVDYHRVIRGLLVKGKYPCDDPKVVFFLSVGQPFDSLTTFI